MAACSFTRLARVAAFALALASSSRSVAAPARHALEARPAAVPIDVTTLPRIASLAHDRQVAPLVSGFSLSDSFLVQSWGFDDHTGACAMRGWQGIDLTTRPYTSLTTRWLVNQTFPVTPGGLRVLPARVAVGASPVPAVGAYVGIVVGLSHDGAGHAVALVDTSVATPGSDPVALRLVAGGWVAYGTTLPGTLVPAAMTYDAAHARVLVFDGASGHLYGMPDGGGALVTIAGDPAGSAADTLGVRHAFGTVRSLSCDAAGEVVWATDGRVRVLRTDGRVVTLAGTGVPGIGPDGGLAVATQVTPIAAAVSPSGTEVLVVESGTTRVRRIDRVGGTIGTRFDLTGDPRIASLHGVVTSGGTTLVTAMAPSAYGNYAPALVLRAEGDSLRRVAGTGNNLPAFDGAGAAAPLHQGLAGFGPFADDGSGGAFFQLADDGFTYNWNGSGALTGPLLHLVPDASLSQVAGAGLSVSMGTRAYTFGGAQVPVTEVLPDGLDQWLLSPAVATNGPAGFEVHLDALWLEGSSDSNDYLVVEAQLADASWTQLALTAYGQYAPEGVGSSGQGRSLEWGPYWTKVTARVPGTVSLPATTHVRVRVKNAEMLPLAPGPGVVDNIAVQDTLGRALLPVLDFEDGTTGAWTPGVHNGGFTIFSSIMGPNSALPANVIEPVANFDFSDASCVWSFCAGQASLPYGTDAALVSPWVPVARPDSAIYAAFGGKLCGFIPQVEFRIVVQTKSVAGALTSSTSFGPLVSGGADIEQPYFDGRTVRVAPAAPTGADSVRVVFRLVHRFEDFSNLGSGSTITSRFPFVDDVRIVQFAADRDFDGVCDAVDRCPDVSAIGQDADGDGCPDATATLRHEESWPLSGLPLVYHLSQRGDPRIADGSWADAIRRAFGHWTSVPNAQVAVVEGAMTTRESASSVDGINLVTFTDPDFQFPDNVVAVTPTLSFSNRGAFDDRMVLPGQIIDADILFNPAFRFGTPTSPGGAGSFDLEAVATHEIGHLLGLTHSGVLAARMFYVLQPGTSGRTLVADDAAAIGAAYPAPGYLTGTSTLRGTVRRGGSLEPVPGALVTAVRLAAGAPQDSVASDYTDEQGRYALRGLAAGTYGVRVTPLDGEVGGFPLTPDDISLRLSNIARTDFGAEWWSQDESDHDDPAVVGAIALGAGQTIDRVNVVTNVDTTPPAVVGVTPADGTSGVRIDSPVLVRFSERLDRSTFTGSTFVLRRDDTAAAAGGTAYSLDGERAFVFTADPPLAFDTPYTLTLTTGLTDRQGVPLAADVVRHFRTMPAPPVAIAGIQPRQAPVGAFVTLTGDGFDAANPSANTVEFAPCATCAPIAQTPSTVSSGSITVQVPPGAITGPVDVRVSGSPSNSFTFTVLATGTQPAPSPLGPEVAIGFEPSGVSVAADGAQVYAVGAGGLAVIDRSGAVPVVRTFAIGAARAAAVAPSRELVYVTRPDSGDVVAVGADPAVPGTFGRIVARMAAPAGGRPDAVTITAAGTRVVASDERSFAHYAFDTDTRDLTRFQLVRELVDSAAVLNGGLALAPSGDRIVYTTANEGVRQFRWSDASAGSLASGARAERGAAIAITNTEAVFAGGLASPGALVYVGLASALHPTGTIALGGSVRGVVTTPQGASALVVNSTFDRLHVVGLDPASPSTYHQDVADVATGAGPVAIAIAADGSLVAVANATGHSVSLYGAGSGAALLHLVPVAAVPGASVVLQTNGAPFATGGNADFGGVAAAPVAIAAGGGAASVLVPDGPQGTLATAAVDGNARRTGTLAFTRLDAVTRFAPAPTALAVSLATVGCGNASAALAAESPDGSTLAAAWSGSSGCDAHLALVDARAGAGFAAGLGTPVGLGAASAPSGLAWRTDRAEVWTVQAGRPALLVTDATAGPGFGTLAVVALAGANPAGLAADPLGRWMCVADRAGNAVRFVDPGTRTVISSLALPGAAGPLAASPDGRWLVCASGNGAVVVNLGTRAQVAQTPAHVAPPAAIAVTADGRRAVATFPADHAVAVWNLDAAAGPVGQEVFYGAPAGAATASWTSALPAPDAGGIVVGAPDAAELVRLEVEGAAPVVTRAGVTAATLALGRSLDGRRLWRLAPAGTSLELLALDDASSVTVLGGGGQSGPPGSLLPLPVVVRVMDANGAGQAGVTVHVQAGGALAGSIDGGAAVEDARTDAAGLVTLAWTLPASPASTSLAISVPGLPTGAITVTATATARDADIVPVVTALGPGDGAAGILADSPLSASFNQAMDAASLSTALRLLDGTSRLPGGIALVNDGRTAIFTPQSPLRYGATLVWQVGTGAADTDGQHLAALTQARFTVQAAPLLALASVYPPAGPVGTALTLTGSGFSATPGLNTVRIAGVVAPVLTANPTQLTLRVPDGVPVGTVDTWVTVAGASSDTIPFVVHVTDPSPSDLLARLLTSPDVSAALVAPDGQHFAFANPRLGTVSVASLGAGALVLDTTIAVGWQPIALAISADGRRMYVANGGGHDIAVVQSDSGYVNFRVTDRIALGQSPVQIAFSASRQELYVLTGTLLQVVNERPGDGTCHQVTATVNTGSSGHAIVVNPDGGEGYVLTDDGRLLVIDLHAHAVTTTVNTGSSGHAIVITPDGGLLVALLENGLLIVIDNHAGGAHDHQVTATVNTGSSGHAIVVTPDGGTILELDDRGTIRTFHIDGFVPNASLAGAGPAVSLRPTGTLAVGQGPGGLLVDPLGGRFLIATSPGTGEAVLVGVPDLFAPVVGALSITPGTIQLNSRGQWISAEITLPAPYAVADVDIASLRLDGTVPCDTSFHVLQGGRGCSTRLRVRFDRLPVEWVVPVGDSVPITVTGRVGTARFLATDIVRVRRGTVTSPHAGEVVPPAVPYWVRWTSPRDVHAIRVAVMQSLDGGATWSLVTDHANANGRWLWTPPAVSADSARLAVVLIENTCDTDSLQVTGVLATSAVFRISGATDVDVVPTTLVLAPVRPNPAPGRAVFRFALPSRTQVSLELFDLLGRRVRTLVAGERPAGWHEVAWTGIADHGEPARAGVYFARLRAQGKELRQRLVWLE